jgi:hypothetical protein
MNEHLLLQGRKEIHETNSKLIYKYCNGTKMTAETSKASDYVSLIDIVVPLPKTDTPPNKTKSNCVQQLF